MTAPYTSSAALSTDRTAGILSRISWSAVFAGLAIATALQITLTVLGAAIGLTALDGPDSGKAFGVGAAIWALLVPVLTLYLGGATAVRLAQTRDRGDAFMHGALVWALSVLLATWLLGTGASRILGSTLGFAGNVTASAVSAAGQVAGRPDIDRSDVQRAAGQVQDQAGLSEQEMRARAAEAQQRMGEVADTAQRAAAGGAWAALLALGLSFAAAALGARRAVATHGVGV